MDAARLGGRPGRARAALNALRARFEVHRAHPEAAYRLGRIAFDTDQDYATAARWFERYLRRAPNGSLAAEAPGRLMDGLRRAGQPERARQAARARTCNIIRTGRTRGSRARW
jgi:TolA-binding protein